MVLVTMSTHLHHYHHGYCCMPPSGSGSELISALRSHTIGPPRVRPLFIVGDNCL